MKTPSLLRRAQSVLLLAALLVAPFPVSPQTQQQSETPRFPFPEGLHYRVQWRLVNAGSATLRLTRGKQKEWLLNLDLVSIGFVARLYRVLDSYRLTATDKFCGINVNLDAQEGKRHATTQTEFDNDRHKLFSTAKDMTTQEVKKHEVDIPPCTYEITGALMELRQMQLEPGKRATLPVTEGTKLANVRVEAGDREKLTLDGKNYNTIRYETFIFDNVLYRRRGRLLVWLTDDAARVPVQLRFQMGFPIGDITLILEKSERL